MESPYLASVYEYPSWILDFFAERKHKNECKEDWEQYFLELPIHLPNYTLLMTGYHENYEKPLVMLQIVCGHNKLMLKGPQTIYYPQINTTEITPSLTSLKRKFGFLDRLSFERSTYVILWEQKKLIRLKCIRSHIEIPYQPLTEPKPPRKKKVQLHQRTITQMQNSMNLIYTSFKRDLNSFDEQTIHKIFETEIIQIVHNLKHNV
jgi:hypothetical protein